VPGVALEARQVAVLLGVGDELGVPQQFVGLRAQAGNIAFFGTPRGERRARPPS
jgi:hypothetical protein